MTETRSLFAAHQGAGHYSRPARSGAHGPGDRGGAGFGDPVTLSPQTAATQALRLMGEIGFRHLPVVENDKVYGIISLRDFVGFELHLAAEAPEVVESNWIPASGRLTLFTNAPDLARLE